jgi:hypothetical protein
VDLARLMFYRFSTSLEGRLEYHATDTVWASEERALGRTVQLLAGGPIASLNHVPVVKFPFICHGKSMHALDFRILPRHELSTRLSQPKST